MPDRPELMAIGDSIYNGTRSLTTNAELAALAVPAQVARAFGWGFRTPSYPREILFDLEDLFRSGRFDLDGLKQSVLANAQAWLDQGRWSDEDCFDNISIAQTTIADQAALTYNNSVSKIAGLIDKVRDAEGFDFVGVVPALYEAINASFLLNPSNDPASVFADRTPLEIVAERRPKRLLVNIGINDGIWTICLMATKDQFAPDAIATDMHDLGVRLNDMRQAGRIDRVYLNLLPKPSCVANLMPRVDPGALPRGADYFPEYLGRLGQIGGLSGAEMKALDQGVRDLNRRIADDLTETFGGDGLSFVDAYAMMELHDNKHYRETREHEIWIKDWRINNVPLQRWPHKGGLYGLDNLHPTAVGYAILAQAVCQRIEAVEGLAPVAPIDLAAAFRSDSLLTDVPRRLDISLLLINLVVAFAALARPAA
jgi:lysophospholipase L1-like esterase